MEIRKTMKIKKLIISAATGGLLLICLCGCGAVEYNVSDPDTNLLFGEEKRFSLIARWTGADIIYDKTTGVEYVRSIVDGGYVYTALCRWVRW